MASRGSDVLGQHRCEQLARTCIPAKARRRQGVARVVPGERRASPMSTKKGLMMGGESDETLEFLHLSNGNKG